MNFPLLLAFTSGTAFLLGLLLFIPPQKANLTASRYLGAFMITLSLTMLEIPLFIR